MCKFCDHPCQKAGKQKNGTQKFYCTICRKYQQMTYRSRPCCKCTKAMISKLVCEGVSVRGISRILRVAINTVQKDIIRTSKSIVNPPIRLHQENIEVDELRTFIGNKQNPYWIAYALNCATGEVTDFIVGRRSKRTLRTLVNTLLLSGVGKISTDRLNIYRSLIPEGIHCDKRYGTNRSGSRWTSICPVLRVIRVLEGLLEMRGKPIRLRIDNGPEFVSDRLQLW